MTDKLSIGERQELYMLEKRRATQDIYGQAQTRMLPTMQFRWFAPVRKWPTYELPYLQQKFIESTADGGVEHWVTVPTVSDEA